MGLPLYEAQNLGLKVVAPVSSYTQYFSPESIFLYNINDPNDALKKIELITSKSDFWNDSKEAERVMKKMKTISFTRTLFCCQTC